MIVTNDPQIADLARMLRQHGAKTTYYHIFPGFNSRLDAIQSAILRVKLNYLDDWSSKRRQVSILYSELLAELDAIEPPFVAQNNTTSANYYTVRLIDRRINRNEFA